MSYCDLQIDEVEDALPSAEPSTSYQQAALDAQRQGPQRGAQHPGWQPYCACCAPCAATASKLRRLHAEEAAEEAEAEAAEERHAARDRAITEARRGSAFGI